MADNDKRAEGKHEEGKHDTPPDAPPEDASGNPTGVYPVTDGRYPGGEPVSTEAAYRNTRFAGAPTSRAEGAPGPIADDSAAARNATVMADHPAVGSYGETGPGATGEARPRRSGMRPILILAIVALVLVLWVLIAR